MQETDGSGPKRRLQVRHGALYNSPGSVLEQKRPGLALGPGGTVLGEAEGECDRRSQGAVHVKGGLPDPSSLSS